MVWCSDSDNQVTKINFQEWEQLFNSQIEDFQYIKDLDNFFSYNILSITENKPFISDFYFSVNFDKKSSLQWWVEFSQKKFSKSNNLESLDINFSVEAEDSVKNTEPFDLSWSVTLLNKDWELYANLHSLDVFMWEENMVAKMYTLLWDLIIDKWVDLEVHSSGSVIEIYENDVKFPHIVWNLKNVLKTENIESGPDFLNSMVELLDVINSYVDLWISTNELKLINYEISYSELWDKTIQKEFTWSFQWKESAFNLSFMVSKEWIGVRLYDVREYNEDVLDWEDIEKEFVFSLQEDGKSEYLIKIESLKLQQKVVDLQWKIEYLDKLKFSADFILEPLEIMAWEKISWKFDGYLIKKAWEFDKQIPEISGNILSWNELLSSL